MLEIGAQCSSPLCDQIDFLPILCFCGQYFCRAHSPADVHNCSYTRTDTTTSPSPNQVSLRRCAARDCGKPSLEGFIGDQSSTLGRTPAVCPQCQESFCAVHRHPKSHSCQLTLAAGVGPKPKNEAARALLAKHFGASKGKLTTGTPAARSAAMSDPAKRLLLMRHKAIPVNPKDKTAGIPQSDRVHFKVMGSEKMFWARKTIGTGRVLDLLAPQVGQSSTAPLGMYKEDIQCRNDRDIGEEVEDGSTVTLR
ncbi:unnamed protein product [Mycena citricolor]|uniref:AN1-type domain-containing protein n=1 Tax=Mycena citricolor TaxID=2018698 RepID=A0AAD2K564_9AGAR|nr:unnamed protein product [Mycena citricolor]